MVAIRKISEETVSATVSPTSILIVFRQLCLEELGGQPLGCKGAGHDLETKQQQHGFVHFCHVSTVRSYVIKGIICDKKNNNSIPAVHLGEISD